MITFNKKEYYQIYYRNNPEKMKEIQARYRKNHPDKIKEQNKKWRENNPGRKKELGDRWRKNNCEKIREYQKKRYEQRRKWIRNYKLSKGCKICGYNKCATALDFHHETGKEFDISVVYFYKNLDEVKKEIEKCIVLCANCHRELHEII